MKGLSQTALSFKLGEGFWPPPRTGSIPRRCPNVHAPNVPIIRVQVVLALIVVILK